MNLFELTTSLMNIPSVSGEEEAVGFWLRDHLQSLGWKVELQNVSENQNNVIATRNETPRVWFSTHMDTVPPFMPPAEDDEKIYEGDNRFADHGCRRIAKAGDRGYRLTISGGRRTHFGRCTCGE
jgi:acetylornithine deacetylase